MSALRADPQTLQAMATEGWHSLPGLLSDADVLALGGALDSYTDALLAAPARPKGLTELLRMSARENVAFAGESLGSLHRVGHRLFELDVVRKILKSSVIHNLLTALLVDPVVVSAAMIVKLPGSEQAYGLHRDTWFLHPDPEDLLTLSIALDAATTHSGGLEVVPGTHKAATNYRVELAAQGWQGVQPGPSPARPAGAVPVDLAPGDALLIDGKLWHGSPANCSVNRRRLLVAQFSSAAAQWPCDSWIPAPHRRLAELT